MSDKFKYNRTSYLMDLVEKLTPDSEKQTITIMKHSACGATFGIIENAIPEFISKKGLYHA